MVILSKNNVIQLCVKSPFLTDVVKQLCPSFELCSKSISNIDTSYLLSIIEISDDKELDAIIKRFKPEISILIFIIPEEYDYSGIKSHNIYFVKKPFRISSLEKILSAIFKKDAIKLDNCIVDDKSKSILILDGDNGQVKIRLTNKEFEIIYFIAEAASSVSKKEILKRVFGYSVLSNTNTVEVHLHRLKQKLFKYIDISKYIREEL
jgi:hypothetical protein